jgi:PAS domain S-box-containing protein
MFTNLITGKGMKSIEFQWVHKSGELRWGEACGSLVKQGRKIVGAQCVLTDITDKKRITHQLAESEKKYHAIFKNASVGLVIIDFGGTIHDVNPAFCSMYGYQRKDVIGKHATQFMSQDFYLMWKDVLDSAKTAGDFQGETMDIRKDGSYVHMEVKVTKIAIGGTEYLLIILHDITRIKDSDQAVRLSEKRFRSIFENSPIGIGYYDGEGQLLYINQACLELFGIPDAKEAVGFRLFEDPNISDEIIKRLRSGETVQYEAPFDFNLVHEKNLYETKKRGTITTDVIITPLFSEDSDVPVAFIGQVQDVTQVRKAQDRIKKSLDEKELLLKEIHHRVKNNMQIMVSLLRMQSQSIGSEEVRAACLDSVSRIRSMSLIHQQLYESEDFSQIQMDHYVRNLTSNLKDQFNHVGNIEFDFCIDDIVMGINEAIPCGLIFNESITNALKHAFRDRGDGKIIISLQKRTPTEIRLSVADDGVGLNKDFNVNQLKSLGMVLIESLAQQLEGEMQILNQEGTTIQIDFPYFEPSP